MLPTQSPRDVENLATIEPGEEFEIVRMLLDESANANRRFGPGHCWRCRYSGKDIILLVSHTGQTISVRRDVARYIEVRRRGPRATRS
ncbi:MAG TPA: hypothetical protein VFZ69_02900 [Longimicrobiales bacterium]